MKVMPCRLVLPRKIIHAVSREVTPWLHYNIYIYQPFTLIIIIIYINMYIMYIILMEWVDSFFYENDIFYIYKDGHIPSAISAEIHTQANYMRYSWAGAPKNVTSANINTI